MRTLSRIAATVVLLATPPGVALARHGYIDAAPSAPTDNCSASQEQQDAFVARVKAVEARLQEVADRRKARTEELNKANRPKIEAEMAKRSGATSDQMARLKQIKQQERGASAEEKQRLRAEKMRIASEMMQAKMGVSVEEVQNLQKQGDEGKKRWGKAYAQDLQAQREADPSAQPALPGVGSDAKALLENTKLLQELNRRLLAPGERFAQKVRDQEEDPAVRRMLDQLRQKRERIGQLMGVDNGTGEMERLLAETRQLEKDYCNRLGPKYLLYLADFRHDLEALQGDFARYDQAVADSFKLQTGTDAPIEPGGAELAAAQSYVGLLGSVFEYDVRREKK